MISAIEIENFKGIGERQRIELKPITLLFGPNSAGKSTILHALHYARELLDRRTADVRKTSTSGGHVDLGGFREFVHGKDEKRKIGLRFEIGADTHKWSEEFSIDNSSLELPTGESKSLSAIGEDVESAWIEISVGMSFPPPYRTFVEESYEIGLNGEYFATVRSNSHDPGTLVGVNVQHSLLRWPDAPERFPGNSLGLLDWLCPGAAPEITSLYLGDSATPVSATGLRDPQDEEVFEETPLDQFEQDSLREAEVRFDEHCRAITGVRSSDRRIALQSVRVGKKWPAGTAHDRFLVVREFLDWSEQMESCLRGVLSSLRHAERRTTPLFGTAGPSGAEREGRMKRDIYVQVLTRLIGGPLKQLLDLLIDFRHLGPVRRKPPRGYSPSSRRAASDWFDGMAAWDRLLTDESFLAGSVGLWLSQEDRLNTGYHLRLQEGRQVDEGTLLGGLAEKGNSREDVRRALREHPKWNRVVFLELDSGQKFQPEDLGEGIAQVVPVIVSALSVREDTGHEKSLLVAIEQPELHLHPAQQAALGDLLAVASRKYEGHQDLRRSVANTLLVETHSEHLILRILRRIRETTDGELPQDVTAADPSDIAIYYVKMGEGGTRMTRIGITEDGEFSDHWPDGFFPERAEELF